MSPTSKTRCPMSWTIGIPPRFRPEGIRIAALRVSPPGEHPPRVAEDLLLRPVTDHGRLHGALRLHVPALPDPLGLDRPPERLRAVPLHGREEGAEVHLEGRPALRHPPLVPVAVADPAAVEPPPGHVPDPAVDRGAPLDPDPRPPPPVPARPA